MTARKALIVLGGVVFAMPVLAQMHNDEVALPDGYRDAVHYTTFVRGGITEEIYTSQEAVDAARAGAPFPDGTVITMDDFRGGKLTRILVMEKRAEWADRSASGSWMYREFAPDGTPNAAEDGKRCESCHASEAANDYVFTRDRMMD
ncbi:cytochrome P460 family protein [Rhodobium gokarnense]|uniref:Cytochrome P460 domain-containing protein n=1 Tax=Rhodobium gokarnense TaxID=364296 RepID=A0ABT3HET1_9HYPH|nr:cytochrome P460 family protein [Rhodobium gokarnense]MCW2308906.1 hypothetical protein [Rhodobium gokarnense]